MSQVWYGLATFHAKTLQSSISWQLNVQGDYTSSTWTPMSGTQSHRKVCSIGHSHAGLAGLWQAAGARQQALQYPGRYRTTKSQIYCLRPHRKLVTASTPSPKVHGVHDNLFRTVTQTKWTLRQPVFYGRQSPSSLRLPLGAAATVTPVWTGLGSQRTLAWLTSRVLILICRFSHDVTGARATAVGLR